MDNKKLFHFLKQNCELDWRGKELICWVDFMDLSHFTELVGDDYLCEGGMDINLQSRCIAFDILDLLEYADIEPTDLKTKD